jgi:hypothetical protein
MSKTTVVNIHKTPATVFIGRPSKFGNPFKIGPYTREQAIEKFKDYFYRKILIEPEFRKEVEKLRGFSLGCYCKPEACHGDVIAQYLDWKGDEDSTGVNCGRCGAVMVLSGIDVYKCPRCGKEVDMGEDEE